MLMNDVVVRVFRVVPILEDAHGFRQHVAVRVEGYFALQGLEPGRLHRIADVGTVDLLAAFGDAPDRIEDDEGAVTTRKLEEVKAAALERFARVRSALEKLRRALARHGHDSDAYRQAEAAIIMEITSIRFTVKTLDRLDVARAGEEIRITASARSFLQHQVRSMVGSLVHVGEGKWTTDDLASALATRDRTACGQVAPPQGLYLVQVDYGVDGSVQRGAPLEFE